MRIKQITDQHRRDFHAIYICEHCGFEIGKSGYDDDYFHRRVIPKMVCQKCGEVAPANYQPLQPMYGENEDV